MKNIGVIILVAVLVILGVSGCGSYNGMNSSRVEVDKAWANVQSAYQRRADLIPNLVATVKGAAKFEQETYTGVALARAGALKQAINIPADSLNPQRIQEIQKANADAGSAARSAINIAVEAYPQLQATQNFRDLQTQLEGTENRIKTERDNYNKVVGDYNVRVTSFPARIWASMFGFKQRTMFAADAGSENAPKVQF